MLALLLVLPTFAGKKDKKKKPTPQEMAMAATDDAMLASAEQYRAMTAGDIKGVYGWAGALSAAADVGTVERGRIPDDHLAEFFAALDGAPADLKNPSLGMASGIALAAGNSFLALDLAQASLDNQPDNAALTTWLTVADDRSKAADNCKKTLKHAQSDIQKFDTLTLCNAAIGTDWASSADQAWLTEESAKRAASQAEHTAALEARWAEQAEAAAAAAAKRAEERAAAAAASAAAAPSGPNVVSVSMHIDCPQKVRVFKGSSPDSGGTYGWEYPNHVRNVSMMEGDVLCICDASDKKQSCWTASGSSAKLEVGCGGFMQK